MVKIVTGIRRSGKSFLLMNLFHQHLIENGVQESHIIELSMDNRRNKRLRNPDALLDFIDDKIQPDGQVHYVILDEVQLVDDFVEVLLSLMQDRRLDVYVSGSNSKFLSKDVVTDFVAGGMKYTYIRCRLASIMRRWAETSMMPGKTTILMVACRRCCNLRVKRRKSII